MCPRKLYGAMKPIILTTCSNRKRHKPSADLCARNLPKGILEQTVENWWSRVDAADASHLSHELYCGRSFSEARLAANEAQGDFYVISAGLGLVSPNQKIPAYDLTLTKGSQDYAPNKVVEPIQDWEWWSSLTDARGQTAPISNLIRNHDDTLVLIACSEGYLQMIAEDLKNLGKDDLARLRIIGPRDLTKILPQLHAYIMPYGETFDGPDSPIPGTRGDFAQRALHHFVKDVLPAVKSFNDPTQHRDLILHHAANWRAPIDVAREKRTDDEIIELVPRLWHRAKGSSGRMLRILRDQELVACEQGRFATLFKVAKERHCLS
jgi:hypothetical protein